MSRELSEKLLKAFTDTGDMKMSYRELAVISAKEIERLLADRCQEAYDEMERKEKCGHAFANIQPNGCLVCMEIVQEREKVRGLCAAAVENIESGDDGWNYALVKVFSVIRQLDLTQPESDLAPDTYEVSFVCTHCNNAGLLSECLGKQYEQITGPRCPRCDYCVQILRKPKDLAPSREES